MDIFFGFWAMLAQLRAEVSMVSEKFELEVSERVVAMFIPVDKHQFLLFKCPIGHSLSPAMYNAAFSCG